MRTKFIFILLILPVIAMAQTSTYKAIIIGDGVRIRDQGNAKGTEVSKVHGKREVTIIEEGKKRDGLGKTDDCESYPWIKVKWAGDSTGWVYGKYIYYNDQGGIQNDGGGDFLFQKKTYKILTYRNYSFPVADDNGLTGCGLDYHVVLFCNENKKYYLIKDSKSKEGYTYMSLKNDDSGGEAIYSTKGEDDGSITFFVTISYQMGGAEATYSIKYIGGSFTVTEYSKSETKMD